MKKLLKVLAYIVGILLILIVGAYIFFTIKWNSNTKANMRLLGEPPSVLSQNGYEFRDLNKNGKLDIYEDSRASIHDRMEDLLGQMNLEEKAGMMFITMIGMKENGELLESPIPGEPITLGLESNSSLVAKKRMSHFNIMQSPSAKAMATWNNNIQKLAERTRLGIPITIASDPRHTVIDNPGAAIPTPFFSKWCTPLGLAATRDTNLILEFGNIARQEYTALGIRLALSPMADLATEPRWGRINGTFGEDALLSAAMTKAYIKGFQGDSLNANSVACMTKHFAGGGPQKDGEDAHFPYGKDQVYPGNNFDYHLIPFEKGAFPANTAQIMPYYGVPVGQTSEDVGFAFNKEIISDLLREKYNFKGVVCTDWALVTDNMAKPASAFGVEHLSEVERAARIINAGCDMFGGEASPDWIVELVNTGKISMARIDESIRRILRDKFVLGLFDNPYVDLNKLDVIGNDGFIAKGLEAQQRSLVLLKNEDQILPLKPGQKVFVKGLKKEVVSQFYNIVTTAEDADVVLLKIGTPYEPRSKYMLERFFHQGRLDFNEKEKNEYLDLIYKKPTITIVTLERPAVIPDISASSKALIADFNSQDKVILDLILGKFQPEGKLPFELPSSMDAVEAQKEDVPYDSENPLFKYGDGMDSF